MYNRYLPPDISFHPVPPEEDERREQGHSHTSPPPHRNGQPGRKRPASQPEAQTGDLLGLLGLGETPNQETQPST